MADLSTIINDPFLWIAGIPPIVVIIAMAGMFTRQAFRVAPLVKVSKKQCHDSIRIGIVSAVGPSFSIVTVMLALMATLGTATTWSRMSMVGNAPQKVMMAEVGANLFNVAFGGEAYGPDAFATSIWLMTLHGCNFMLAVFLLLHRMDKVNTRLGSKNEALMPVIGAGALAGIIAILGLNASYGNTSKIFSYVFAFVLALGIGQIAKKIKGLAEYKVGLAMLISMLVTQYLFRVIIK
ncbi:MULTISPECIES: DUF5058 family protein [unclassified Clostridium]|uniref:DUF5058 family protein n=1 Tax=unclassified Clostridium TaxID=2614128 RepID=UPI001105A5E5|nr:MULTISPECIES: DUF5058 family protein [unclassified Clostridium]